MDAAKRLELFAQRVEELHDSRAVRSGLKNRLNIKWNRTEGLRIEADQPDDEELRSFLVPFRKFIMSNEPIFLDRVLNVCELCLTDQELKDRLREAREEWKRVRRKPWVALEINGETLTPERIADLWINGRIFHDDEAKGQAFERMTNEIMAMAFLKHQFLDCVIDATRVVFYMAEIIKDGMVRNLFALGRESVSADTERER